MNREDRVCFSRRNRVCIKKNGRALYVEKAFTDQTSYAKELEFYLAVRHDRLKMPQLLAYDDQRQIIELEHVEGILLTDLLVQLEETGNVQVACGWLLKTLDWLNVFHALPIVRHHGWMIHDINLRNFIVAEESIYGFDFEQVQEGSRKRDLIRLLAMYLHEDPVESPFKQQVIMKLKPKVLIMLDMNEEVFQEIQADEIKVLLERRRKK